MLKDTVKDYEFSGDIMVNELVNQMKEAWGFTAGKVAVGVDILERMIRTAGCVKFLSFTGNLVATGARGVFKELAKRKLVDVIITTCGTLDHDLARCWRSYYKGSFVMNDAKLHEMGIKVVGVPKTIDNDLACTDYTFGFDTAVSIVAEALDRLHTTAESHHRVLVVEVMGRYAGWIALFGGIAGGADFIVIPEKPVTLDEICQMIKKRQERGKNFSIIVVAEGAKIDGQEVAQAKAKDEFGHARLGGIGYYLAEKIEEKTGLETRAIVLGHLQRGGTPTAYDRILATRFGIAAIDLVHDGKFGMMPVLQGDDIVAVPIKNAVANRKTADLRLYEVAKIFFG